MLGYTLLLCLLCCAAGLSAGALNFLVVGDWGGSSKSPYTTKAQLAVSKAMGTQGAAIGSQFTLALGDNFYEFGVKDVDDPRFKETFEDVFTASSLQSKWYVICGNHDHYGNCSAEIAYSKKSHRWVFPDFFYKQVFQIPGSDLTLKTMFIDTVLLAALTDTQVKSYPSDYSTRVKLAEDHWDWINQTLAEFSKTDGWTIVIGHYPVWSVAEHGPTSVLVQRLKPLMEKYKVAAYYCGHDHNLQHLTDGPIEYYVVGAGHLIDPSLKHEKDVPEHSLKFHYGPNSKDDDAMGGFASVSVTVMNVTTTYFDYTGKQIYQKVINKV